jgi:hypothetical protein
MLSIIYYQAFLIFKLIKRMKVRKKKILNTKTGSEEEKGKLKKESENFTAVN